MIRVLLSQVEHVWPEDGKSDSAKTSVILSKRQFNSLCRDQQKNMQSSTGANEEYFVIEWVTQNQFFIFIFPVQCKKSNHSEFPTKLWK